MFSYTSIPSVHHSFFLPLSTLFTLVLPPRPCIPQISVWSSPTLRILLTIFKPGFGASCRFACARPGVSANFCYVHKQSQNLRRIQQKGFISPSPICKMAGRALTPCLILRGSGPPEHVSLMAMHKFKNSSPAEQAHFKPRPVSH